MKEKQEGILGWHAFVVVERRHIELHFLVVAVLSSQKFLTTTVGLVLASLVRLHS